MSLSIHKCINMSLSIYKGMHMSLSIYKHIDMSLSIHKHINMSLSIHEHIDMSLSIYTHIHFRLFEIRRTERAENHKDQQCCQVCRSGCPTNFFVLHRKSEMQLVCRNDHGHLGIRFCFK